jgi:hypothetical protein
LVGNLLEQAPPLGGTGSAETAVVGRREVVFYESSVAGYQTLLAGAAPGSDQVVLDAHDDGLHAMAAFLAGHRGYDAVAVVAHGASGELALGTGRLDADTLAGYGPDLATLGAALNPGGDLLLYGCDVAAGPAGAAFVQRLAQATGADVASASHPVGSAALGGSWQLDYQTGPINAGLPFNTDGFQGVLDVGDQSNLEGDQINLQVPFTGSAGPLFFTVTGLPPGLSVGTADNVTAQITGTITAGSADVVPYTVTVTATDVPAGQFGTYSSAQTFNWTVSRRITVNPIDDQSNTEGDSVSLDVTATSPDSSPLEFTADGLPDGLSLVPVDAHTARITGTVAPHAADNAPEDTTVTASDGTYSASQTFVWDLAGNPPDLTVGPDLTVAAGTTVTLQASATAASGIASVSWQVSYDGEGFQDTGLTTLTPQYTFGTFGDYDLLVTVTDNNGESSEKSLHVTVTEVTPLSPDLTITPSTVVRAYPVTFDINVQDPDTLDTTTVYADWEHNGAFDQVNDWQWQLNPDNSFSITFTHTYYTPGTFNPVIRLSDDGGQTADYNGQVTVQGVNPAGTLGTTSPYFWNTSGTTDLTYAMSPGPNGILTPQTATAVVDGSGTNTFTLNPGSPTTDVLRFTNVTPPDTVGLEYHFFITDTSPGGSGTAVETVTDQPTLALPDYKEGKTYHVEGFVKDMYSANQSPRQSLNVVVGDWNRALWGTLSQQGQDAPPDASTDFIRINSNTATGMQFKVDSAGFGVWPSNSPIRVYWQTQVYDISPWFLGVLGSPRHDLLPNESTSGWADGTGDTFTFTVPGGPDYREIHVFATVKIPGTSDPTGVTLGTAGLAGNAPGSSAFAVSQRFEMVFRTNQPPTILDQLVNGLQMVRDLASRLVNSAGNIISAIISDPGTFFNNLFNGLGQAAHQVFDNLTGDGLRQRLFQWLTGGVTLPNLSSFNFSTLDGIKNFLIQYAGLTWDHLKSVIMQQVGAGNWAAASKIYDLLQPLDPTRGGDPTQVWSWLQGLPAALGADADVLDNFDFSAMASDLWSKAQTQLANSAAQIVPRLLAKFVPGAGFIVSLYQGLTWVLNNQQTISDFINAFCNALDNLASGNLSSYVTQLVNAIQGPGLNALLSFAASQLGLGNLQQQVQQVINWIPNKVDEVMRKAVAAIAGKITALLSGGSSAAGSRFRDAIATPATFTYAGRSYTLWVAKEAGNVLKVKIWTNGWTDPRVLTARDFDDRFSPGAGAHLQALVNAAVAIRNATTLADTTRLQSALTAADGPLQTVIRDIQANACSVLSTGCFAAGTKLWTPEGYRNIEDIQPDDWVYARAEDNPDGPIEAKRVEKRFERTGHILHLHLPRGVLIRTTPEHPFFVKDWGWRTAGELRGGEVIRTDAGWTTVEEVYDTDEYEPVYNVRVADYHTYFVGDAGWGFGVWAHNAYQVDQAPLNTYMTYFGGTPLSDGTRWLFPYHSLNMSASNWDTYQQNPADRPMPSDHKYVYLLFNRAQHGTNLEIMKVGKVADEPWAARFAGDGYRDLAILGVPVTIYAFDLGPQSATTPNAGTVETAVRRTLWGAMNGTTHRFWLPYDGAARPRNNNPLPNDPYGQAVRRDYETTSSFDVRPFLSGTSLVNRRPVAQVDLNYRLWRNRFSGFPNNHRYIYILEARQEGEDSPRKILKVGNTGLRPISTPGTYINRFEQYIALYVNYEGGASFGYRTSGVTAHIFDVTTLTSDASSLTALEDQVRRELYDQGYRLPLDHELEDGTADIPAWRNATDNYRRALYNG